jgi:propionate CoA-transferase
MTAWQAVDLIKDGAIMGTSGIAGNQRCALIYWTIRERFLAEKRPANITIVCVGGQGGRGKIPGTLEEIALEGLNTRLFTGHAETFKAQLKLADAGKLEIQIIPQGTLTLLLKAQTEGRDHVINNTGAGTLIDPRTGRGTPLTPGAPQYVEVLEDGRFKYGMPKIDTAVFSAPAADRKGNIYVKNCAVLAESWEIAKAAKRNGGKVIVNVGRIVEEGYDKVFLPAEDVDAVVYWPGTEQAATVKHRKHWELFTTDSTMKIDEGIARVRIVNDMLGVTPRRKPVDNVLARLATKIFTDNAHDGDHVDIGVGLPEEVSRILYESGAVKHLTMINESGVFGGMAAPGIFFGAAINPTEIVSSATAFERVYKRLDWAILGALETDSAGNVNVSKRGEGARNYVGPGGFIDLVTNAKALIFCSAWGERAKIDIQDGKLCVAEPGTPKYIDKVSEITFNGADAIKHGKKVFYVTHVGAFQLTPRGMELIYTMPGIDVQKDIISACPMRIVMPESGRPNMAGSEIVTGKGFCCNIKD